VVAKYGGQVDVICWIVVMAMQLQVGGGSCQRVDHSLELTQFLQVLAIGQTCQWGAWRDTATILSAHHAAAGCLS
jgi:hypothetical protein